MRRDFEEKAISREDLLLNEFYNIAIHRYKWNNLPPGLTSERLEEMIIDYGLLGATLVEGTPVILPMRGTSKVNLYNEEVKYVLWAFNGQEYHRDVEEVVKLKGNPLGTSEFETLQFFAKKIDDIEQTQDVNLFQQQIPKLIGVAKEGILTAKNIIKQIKEQKFVVFTKTKGIESQIKKEDVLDNTAPYLLDKLSDYENFYVNKLLTRLGINNINNNKRERLIEAEVNANNDLIEINVDIGYDMRTQFCKDYNKKFNKILSVEKRKVEVDGDIYTNVETTGGE